MIRRCVLRATLNAFFFLFILFENLLSEVYLPREYYPPPPFLLHPAQAGNVIADSWGTYVHVAIADIDLSRLAIGSRSIDESAETRERKPRRINVTAGRRGTLLLPQGTQRAVGRYCVAYGREKCIDSRAAFPPRARFNFNAFGFGSLPRSIEFISR